MAAGFPNEEKFGLFQMKRVGVLDTLIARKMENNLTKFKG